MRKFLRSWEEFFEEFRGGQNKPNMTNFAIERKPGFMTGLF